MTCAVSIMRSGVIREFYYNKNRSVTNTGLDCFNVYVYYDVYKEVCLCEPI